VIRATITGEYSRAALNRLLLPIAWSGTTSAETRAAEESGLAELVEEALVAIDSDPDAVAVQIADGVVVATIHGDES
jgi:hypothetical protein